MTIHIKWNLHITTKFLINICATIEKPRHYSILHMNQNKWFNEITTVKCIILPSYYNRGDSEDGGSYCEEWGTDPYWSYNHNRSGSEKATQKEINEVR